MKVSELEGALLDFWVVKAEQQFEGGQFYLEGDGQTWVRKGDSTVFRPSIFWESGGPIIDRERIATSPCENEANESDGWVAFLDGCEMHGPEMLIAAMRAYVASKFGDEVPEKD